MAEILVRYGCEGCSRWTDDPNEFVQVKVRPFNSRGSLPDRIDLYCRSCFAEREGQPVTFRKVVDAA